MVSGKLNTDIYLLPIHYQPHKTCEAIFLDFIAYYLYNVTTMIL